MPAPSFAPAQLKGKTITLRLLEPQDLGGLSSAGREVDWSWMFSSLGTLEAMQNWIEERIRDFNEGY